MSASVYDMPLQRFTCLSSFAGSSGSRTVKGHAKSDKGEDGHNNHKCSALVGTAIEILFIVISKLGTSVPDQSNRDQE